MVDINPRADGAVGVDNKVTEYCRESGMVAKPDYTCIIIGRGSQEVQGIGPVVRRIAKSRGQRKKEGRRRKGTRIRNKISRRFYALSFVFLFLFPLFWRPRS